jgi:hypothetical protein
MTENEFDNTADVQPDEAPEAPEATEHLTDKLSLDKLEKLTPKEVGDMALKFASETAYAAAGFANLVAEKAREFAEKQRAAVADVGADAPDHTKAFLDQVSAQMNRFVDELGHTYKDLADRGRDAVAKMQQQAAAKPDAKDAPGMFDIVDDAETAEPASTVAEDEIVDAVEVPEGFETPESPDERDAQA